MAACSHFIWIPLLLSCIFPASDNRHVSLQGSTLISRTGHSEVDDILSKIPITLPEGIDPKNVNITSISIKTCTDAKGQLILLSRQLQEATLHNSQLDVEAFGLRREIRLLKLQLATCSSTASAITSSYQTQLQSRMKQLLDTFDSDTFQILKIISLTREVEMLQKKLKIAANSSETTLETRVLKSELQKKMIELNDKKQQIEESHTNSTLILQIISLQNQIWDLEQEESRRGETSTQLRKRILALQEQLNRKISELRGKGDATSAMLQLISVHSKIAALQRLISVHIDKSRDSATDYQRQFKQKTELLKKKILQLNRDESNTELTKEILTLQAEVENLRQLMLNAKKTRDSQIGELRVALEEEKKQQENLQKQLEEIDYSQSQLIIKIIDIMKEVRELEDDEQQQTTSTSQATTLQALLQAKEREFAKAQADIKELQRKLQLKSEECSGLEERYAYVKNELEQKIAELNRTGDSKAALVLNVINLHNELQTLKDLIVTTEDPERVLELQRQLREKQQELSSKTADIQRMIPSPKMILTIIELQSEIWDLQKKAANETTNNRIKELQTRVDGLITEINDKGNDNTKLILKIMTLQSQVEQLQRQLSDLQVMKYTQLTQLKNDLNTKKNELQKYVNELNEKNEANARLILTITDLNNQLRNLQEEKQNDGQTASATITNLREQLTVKVEEHLRDQDQIKALEDKLNQTEAQCSDREQKIKDLQNDLDEKMKELETQSDGVTSLALQVSTLTLQLEELKRQLQNTDSKAKIKELQKQIEEKNNELAKKTEELKATSTQPQRLLQIISIQTEIEKYVNVAANDSDYAKIRALQDHLNYLIDGIKDEDNENTKLVFKVLSYQDEIAKLKKQEESQTKTLLEKIKELENELEDIRNQITEKTLELDSSDTRITNLSAQIMELHQKIKPLEDEISYLKETNTDNLSELQNRLSLTEKQLQDSELRLKDSDAKNFNLIMEIADLRTQLKKAQRQTSKAAEKNINELEQQLQTQQRENRKLEHANRDLKQEVKELKTCCSEDSIHCEGLQRQLQQSQEDADRLQQQLQDRDTYIEQLQQELKNQTDLERQLQETQDNADNLQQQLDKKDDIFTDLQQELEALAAEKNKLLDDYNDLLNERNKLEDTVQDLQNKLQDVDEKTIYTSKTTLDPNTAHPRIVLSADNTEMSTSEELQNVSDNPGRFDVVLAVLGKTGFSAGRHYWEVSVAGKLCYHLGMASESAPRKGTVTFNPRNGFWTIVLNKQGQYRAIDRIPASIPVETQPLTLGILLDYKKGQISFYDAGARSHLYSFTSQKFTDKIYPFINFCVEDVENQTPIVILTAGSTDWIK
ncbi:putative leucine-rich repeat-containing protein DDB_G0290503 isoform X2 [Toxotes jaculatrix]|uniref:putative leucine-rich repeat-containing protein DDB_G0290503 isoform X2 n=1 Tax=Toxotes jaculatrix TaxID=941984 RepID=UPI001B3B15F9|nr:putative leucine-rich repeat-containing protein DDB_G0290503 isoform X2 [Toxotes jaculatrix]